MYARPGTGAPEAWPWAWRVETFVWLRLGTVRVSASRPCPSCGHCESRVSQSTASFIALSPAGLRSLLYRASLSLPPRSAAPVAAPGSLARAATRAKPRARGVRAGAAEHRSEERVHQINTHVPAQPPAPPCPSPLRSRLARRSSHLSRSFNSKHARLSSDIAIVNGVSCVANTKRAHSRHINFKESPFKFRHSLTA